MEIHQRVSNEEHLKYKSFFFQNRPIPFQIMPTFNEILSHKCLNDLVFGYIIMSWKQRACIRPIVKFFKNYLFEIT